MKNITIAVYAALMLSIFNSCTEDYPIDLSGVEPMLVVSGSISTDTMTHTVILTKSQDYFENKPFEGISSATVTISDGSKEFILLEDPNKKGYYRTAKNVFGEVGKTYTLSISNVDINKDGVYETYTASSKLNFVPSIDSIEIEKTRRFSQTQWVIKMTTTDPGDTRDFYLLKILKNNVLISDSLEEWGISDDEFFNGKTLKSYPTMTLSE